MSRFGSVLKIECASCGKPSTHTVVFAKDAVQHLHCMECGAVNAFSIREIAVKKISRKKGRVAPLNHEALTKLLRSAKQKPYSASRAYTDGQLIEHPKFGPGYILAVGSPPKKMVVLFSDRRRVLVCGPGSANGAPKQAAPEVFSNNRVGAHESGPDSLFFLHEETDSHPGLLEEELAG